MSHVTIDHDEAVELLAWYATGSLEGEEHAAVAEHVDDCVDCQRELRELRLLHQSVAEVGAEEPQYRPSLADEVLVRIDVHERAEHDRRRAPGPVSRLVAAFSGLRRLFAWESTPAFARLAIVGQFALLIVLGVVAVNRPAPDRIYETSSGETATVSGARVSVVFNASATVADVQLLLQSLDAEIVAGPTALGLYTLAVGPAGRTEHVIERLEASGLAQYAAPVTQ